MTRLYVAWGVARGRDGRDFARQRAFTREKIEDTERLKRPQGLLPKGEARLGLDLGLLEGRPVGLVHDIAGAGERGTWAGPALTQVPADMVGVTVREEDGVHLLGTDTGGVQFRQELSIDAPSKQIDRAGVGGLAPEAGIHEDGTSLRAQEITPVMVAPDIRAIEQLWVALPERCPGVRRDSRKEMTLPDGEIAGVIGEGHHLDIANEQFAFRHGCVPPLPGFLSVSMTVEVGNRYSPVWARSAPAILPLGRSPVNWKACPATDRGRRPLGGRDAGCRRRAAGGNPLTSAIGSWWVCPGHARVLPREESSGEAIDQSAAEHHAPADDTFGWRSHRSRRSTRAASCCYIHWRRGRSYPRRRIAPGSRDNLGSRPSGRAS